MAIPCQAHGANKLFDVRQTPSAGSGSARSGGWRLGGGRRGGGGKPRIEPADVDPAVQALWGLGIDMALAHQAAESGLNMRAWAAEPVVNVEVADSGVEIVPPQQADHPAAKPDAFRVAGRPDEQVGGLGDLVDAFLAFFGGAVGRFLFFRWSDIATLGDRRGGTKAQRCHAERSTQYAQQGY